MLTILFDCWIQNGDRTLSALGGNPNLLWSDAKHCLHIIDHNLAFELDVPQTVADHHVFKKAGVLWTAEFRSKWRPKLVQAAKRLNSFWEELPESWLDNFLGLDLPWLQQILSHLPWDNVAFSQQP